ncbi:DUF4367 domain-containing protein [Metabacillus niabensis]|uniref:DUF4367 domain-containing protein n=1 Tax=Metabacillus niabensis TaxID=324854 RepID=UPI00399FE182
MNVSKKLTLSLFLIVNFLFGIEVNLVQAIKYNHNSITIPELKKKVDFKVLTPQDIPADWTLDIKTYPWDEKENITDFKLHYMDKNDKFLMIGIEEKKVFGNLEKIARKEKELNINRYKGYYSSFKPSINNEILWVEFYVGIIMIHTYIEMYSSTLTEEQMINIAKSMEYK